MALQFSEFKSPLGHCDGELFSALSRVETCRTAQARLRAHDGPSHGGTPTGEADAAALIASWRWADAMARGGRVAAAVGHMSPRFVSMVAA